MIRDPSDGTIKVEHQRNALETNAEKSAAALLDSTTSGLAKDDPSYAHRIAKSREWLKEYHARKGKS